MKSSQVVEVVRHGGPDVLKLSAAPIPVPGPGEVVIETRAIGINFADVFARMGLYDAAPPPPFVPGFEGAGLVSQVGAGVGGFRPGDRVTFVTRFRGYARHVAVPDSQVTPLPEAAGFEEGAAFPCVYLTAYHALHVLGRVRDGMKVLVHAAAGGVGTAALQLLKEIPRVEVFATVGSPEKIKLVKDLGAQHAIDYRQEDFARIVKERTGGRGVDLVLDSVGGDCFWKSYDILAPVGHLVAFGAATMMPAGSSPNWLRLGLQYLTRPKLDVLAMIGQNKTVSGFNLVHLFGERDLMRSSMTALVDRWQAGRIRPMVGRTYPFDRAGEAQEALRSRTTTGKLVLTVTGG